MPDDKGGRDSAGARLDSLVDAVWEESTRIETVLVVHGYRSLREALVRTLEYYGYRALEASTREQALRMARRERPDVVLLEFDLGDNDSPALAVEIARRVGTHGIPVLALSSDRVSREGLRLYGFSEALVMPVEQKDLLTALDRVLEPARREIRAGLRLPPTDEQCRLPLEDRLRSEHLSLFFRFPTETRINVRDADNARVRDLSCQFARLGVHPEVRLDGGDLVWFYELSIADALSLDPPDPMDGIVLALIEAFPELALRPNALRTRIASLAAEYHRLQRVAS